MVYLKPLSSIQHVLAAFTPYRLSSRREAEHDDIFFKRKTTFFHLILFFFSSNSLPLHFMPCLVKAGEFSSHSLCTLLFEILNMCLEFGLLPVYVIMEILDYK